MQSEGKRRARRTEHPARRRLSPLRWRVTSVRLLVTEEVVHCSHQCPYPTPQKPPVKFGTISKLLRRKDKWNSVLNMETARVATTLLKRTANILVHRGKRKKKCLLCYKPMVLKMRTWNNSLLTAPLLLC